MSGVNRVILIGRCGKDPEVRFLPSGMAVANFSLATSESRKDKESGEKTEKTEWHRCAAFGKTAEIVQQYVKKGSLLYVDGKLSTSQYEKDGQTHYATQVVVNTMQMLGGKSGDKSGANEYAKASGASGTERQPGEDFDDSSPF